MTSEYTDPRDKLRDAVASRNQSVRVTRIQRFGEQECPRRIENGDSGGRVFPLPDYWGTGTWASTQEEADAEVAEFMASNPNGGIGNVLWLYPGQQPRTCSYCGGGHPDDLIALVQAGWEVDETNKGYKRYVEPPGYREYTKRLRERMGTHVAQEYPQPQYPSPVPPVKLYVQHMNDDQIRQFNTLLRESST